jgi:phosphate starvation-inducible PhoH-like protein
MKMKRDCKDDYYPGKSLSSNYSPKTENQKKYYAALRNPDVPIVLGVGPAGTGKTLFACTTAIEALKRGDIQKIVLTRPIVPVDEEELGFLPGDLKNKMAPWTQPLFDIFLEYYSKAVLDAMVKEGVIEISPLAFMRGRTFKRCYVIADEMQNSSPNQMMMLTTRIGTGTRMFITGDLAQTDRDGKNGLLDFSIRSSRRDSLVDQGMVKIVNFDRSDVERSEIVNRVVQMYSGLNVSTHDVDTLSDHKTDSMRISNKTNYFFRNNTALRAMSDFPILLNDTLAEIHKESEESEKSRNISSAWSPTVVVADTKIMLAKNKTKWVADNDCAIIPKDWDINTDIRKFNQ